MQRRMIFGWFAGMMVMLAMFAFNTAAASQFTADMTMKQGSDTTTGKIYVKNLKYRMDMVEDGHQIFVIVDQTAALTRVLLPEGKMYIEMGTQDFRSLMKDPFQGVKYTASIGESKHMGTETVNGYECDKYLISINDQNSMTQWVSQKLEFPVRIIMDISETNSIELQNIQENPVDDALFEIPVDYTIMKTDEPAKEPPVQTPKVTKEMPEAAKETPVQTTEVTKETQEVSREQAKALFDTYAEARNQFKLDMLDQIYHSDVVVHDCSVPEDIKGLDALKKYYSNTHAAFSNINFSADQIFIDGDRIISIWIFRAVSTDTFHTPLGNAPPTGKEVTFSGIAIDRLVDGKFAEEWVYFNLLDPLLQLGFRVVPPQVGDAK